MVLGDLEFRPKYYLELSFLEHNLCVFSMTHFMVLIKEYLFNMNTEKLFKVIALRIKTDNADFLTGHSRIRTSC